ncbi:uncharacterized protein LOC110022959 [Phalaenopsis equestris]|uniref:uncharacterized protein LOC110022959 n=1 Tax=Phalaenopsis equestris TaxID=78828 RepID=UPI0009E229F3|nr:uncharacterized protein LOC110022959 [Phalaenopsis equestris]
MASSSRAIASLLFLVALMSLLITPAVSFRAYLGNGDLLVQNDFIISSGLTLTLRDCKLEFRDLSYRLVWKSDNKEVGKSCTAGLNGDGLLVINSGTKDVWKSKNKSGGTFPFLVIIKEDKPYAAEIIDRNNEVLWSSIKGNN